MQWPDVIQTIARQYGIILTDDDVKTMSFEEKSKWLIQNPISSQHFLSGLPEKCSSPPW